MPRYKEYSYDQGVMIPIRFDEQILPGSIEEAIHCIVDRHIDMSLFDSRYKNDDDGAPAYDPRILLKILLLAYSRGITSSRKIEQLCRENIIFMAISAETKPDHATIAKFVSKMDKEIQWLFRDILLICQEMGLLGGELYAIDGCKIPSNASKEWSGTKQDYERKKQKLESTIAYLVNQHKQNDTQETQESNAPNKDNERRINNLEKKVAKIKKWIAEHEDKIGQRGNIKKSNITDNESAKMPSSHGVIQGYNGIASVDDKHQIIVSAKAYGEGQENVVFPKIIDHLEQSLEQTLAEPAPLNGRTVLADSGFHSKDNVDIVNQKSIDAYIPDVGFRKRDPRFAQAQAHRKPVNRTKKLRKNRWYKPSDFVYDEQLHKLICPAGKQLYIKNSNYEYKGSKAIAYMARASDCGACHLRHQCIRNQNTPARQVHIFYDHEAAKDKALEAMKQKIDSPLGRYMRFLFTKSFCRYFKYAQILR